MKAMISEVPGGPETLRLAEIASPAVAPGRLLIQVWACGLNFPDLLFIEDRYQFKPPRPFSPGGEVTGRIIAVGAGVTGWSVGEQVISVTAYGGLAEQVLADPDMTFRLPAGADPIEGAGLVLTYATAMHALADRGQLEAGQTLLVLGAAGGVGLAGIEVGKALGATVVAAVSTLEKAESAIFSGADRTLVYGAGPFSQAEAKALARAFKEAVEPAGADIVYDPVGGAYAEPALRSIAWYGRYLAIGFPAGSPSIPLNLALLKSCDIRGVFWDSFAKREPEKNRRNIEILLHWWQQGTIKPRIAETWPLPDAGKAIARLAGRQAIGKLVVEVGSWTAARLA